MRSPWLDLRGFIFACLVGAPVVAAAAAPPPPIKALLFVGGGYHDYARLAPHLATNLSALIRVEFTVKDSLNPVRRPQFADGFDAVVYDWCFDEAPDDVLEHVLQTTAAGKPTVMIHCAVHAFRRSPKIAEWETCCGMRSKVHDRYQSFTVVKLDAASAITKAFPDPWTTPGDELYQTISIFPDSHPLLKAKSPQDGREHTVCWTRQYKAGNVFSTTLGHDMKTSASPDYLRLLARGLLWTCSKLQPDGTPAPGYAGPAWGQGK